MLKKNKYLEIKKELNINSLYIYKTNNKGAN